MSVRYFHGGRTIHGTTVLPQPLARTGDDGDGWVYITPLRNLALTYGATCHGWLYEVEPIGDVERDPGSILETGASMRCRSARIVRRWRISRRECAEAIALVDRFARELA